MLALTFLVAQFASGLHRAEIAHRLCAEHGTLEHAPAGHITAPAAGARGQDGAPLRAAPDGAPAPGSDAHAACELAELLNASPAAPATPVLVPSAVPPDVVHAAVSTEVRPREVRGRRESARGPPRAA